MLTARKNFISAISDYLEVHNADGVMYSQATLRTYNLALGHCEIDTMELVAVIEDLAASYISIQDMGPVEAVELAYEQVKDKNISFLNMRFSLVMCLPRRTLESKRRYIFSIFN